MSRSKINKQFNILKTTKSHFLIDILFAINSKNIDWIDDFDLLFSSSTFFSSFFEIKSVFV